MTILNKIYKTITIVNKYRSKIWGLFTRLLRNFYPLIIFEKLLCSIDKDNEFQQSL